ncbi:unnamed protein product, partial [Symbiodinium sp. KB8]
MGGDRARDRDRGSGRERQRERRERVVEDSSVGERFDLLESRLESTAALASSTAFRVGNESSRRSLVYFVQGDLKARLESKWATWQRNAALPVQRRPKEKPTPWKLQVYTEFLDYVKLLRQAKRRWNPYSSPLQRSRNSETGQATREHWYMASGVHRKVTDFLPGKGGGKGYPLLTPVFKIYELFHALKSFNRMARRGLLCWSSGTVRPDRQLANIGRSRTFFRVRVVEK